MVFGSLYNSYIFLYIPFYITCFVFFRVFVLFVLFEFFSKFSKIKFFNFSGHIPLALNSKTPSPTKFGISPSELAISTPSTHRSHNFRSSAAANKMFVISSPMPTFSGLSAYSPCQSTSDFASFESFHEALDEANSLPPTPKSSLGSLGGLKRTVSSLQAVSTRCSHANFKNNCIVEAKQVKI